MPKRSSALAKAQAEKRVLRSKETVLQATYQLLMEVGLSGVSVDEVAKRSGVAKTTIYRHWPSRTELLLDACSSIGVKFDVPDTGTLKGDLTAIASSITSLLRSKNFSSVVPSVIDAAERDATVAALQVRMHTENMAPFYVVIERARQRGELPLNCATSEIIAAVVGPIFYRRWFSREPIDDGFVKSVVNRAIVKP